MRTEIQSIHFDADRKLLDYVQTKVGKLSQFFDRILDTQVSLRLEKNHQDGNKLIEIKVLVPQNTLIASQRGRTFEEATDLCLDQIKAQLKRHKEKIRD